MLGIRRCHDLDRSGWFYLLMFIPIIDFFVALYLLFAQDPGPNQYCADPWTASLPADKETSGIPKFLYGYLFCIIHISTPLAP